MASTINVFINSLTLVTWTFDKRYNASDGTLLSQFSFSSFCWTLTEIKFSKSIFKRLLAWTSEILATFYLYVENDYSYCNILNLCQVLGALGKKLLQII